MLYQRFAVLLSLILALSACCSPFTQSFCCSPSGCKEAQDSFARYAPIISAIEQYNKEHGDYPQTLNDLVPAYVPEIMARKNGKLTYNKLDKSYRLEFTYTGPGLNTCWYGPEDMKWKCDGLF